MNKDLENETKAHIDNDTSFKYSLVNMKKDKRTMTQIVRIEGTMMACDYWCARYINLPLSLRYSVLFTLLSKWAYRKNSMKIRRIK